MTFGQPLEQSRAGGIMVENLGQLDDLQEESLRELNSSVADSSGLGDDEFADERTDSRSRSSGSHSSRPLISMHRNSGEDMYGTEGDLLWKALVVTLLTLIGSAAGFVFLYGLIEGDLETTDTFQVFTRHITARGPQRAKDINGGLATWSNHFGSYATDHPTVWPFHRFPRFQLLASNQQQLAMALLAQEEDSAADSSAQVQWIATAPLISDETRTAWENYTQMTSPLQGQEQQIHYYDETTGQTVVSPQGSGPFIPLFQMHSSSSTVSSAALLNLNLFSYPAFSRAYSLARYSLEPVLSEPVVLPAYWTQYMFNATTADDDEEPYAILVNPIVQKTTTPSTSTLNTSISAAVGVMVGLVPYKAFLEQIIPSDANGIVIVPSPSGKCSEAQQTSLKQYTFTINGPKVVYTGPGDKHDQSYDYHEIIMPWDPFLTSHIHQANGGANMYQHANNHDIDHGYNLSSDAQTMVGKYLDHATNDKFNDDNDLHNPDDTYCPYELRMYPTDAFYNGYRSNAPRIFAAFLVGIFLFVYLIISVYTYLMKQKDKTAFQAVQRSNAVVDMFFPKEVKDRLLEEGQDEKGGAGALAYATTNDGNGGGGGEGKNGAFDADNSFSRPSAEDDAFDIQRFLDDKPIASLFPETTVIFADIAGFTAWSSEREPSQVFILLETIYGEFDKIAKRRKVFKVETIGDCYLAVTGIPDPQEDHAIIMCQFAREAMSKMYDVTASLELTLGPDTSDLAMRMGLHSGPVTAGVLRGRKSHFQLFGDTVNTAARMESTGMREKIQISEETAALVKKSGRGHWIKERDTGVDAKGKGTLTTHWLLPRTQNKGSSLPSSGASYMSRSSATSQGSRLDEESDGGSFVNHDDQEDEEDDSAMLLPGPAAALRNALPQQQKKKKYKKPKELSAKSQRLVQWNVALLQKLLEKVASARTSQKVQNPDKLALLERDLVERHSILAEVEEVIQVSKTASSESTGCLSSGSKKKPGSFRSDDVRVPKEVVDQMVAYVSKIALLHPENAFHNFEHASHVTMSTSKLLSRIVNANEANSKSASTFNAGDVQLSNQAHVRHAHFTSYGITSDPLTQFSVVFSALIHDVDHPGVSNAILTKEEPAIGELYDGKSVAEQRSVDIAFALLMEPDFEAFRHFIYTDEHDLMKFRQLIVNSVIATDIFDREHGQFRKARWAKAFDDDSENMDEGETMSLDRKATIVIEHLIQASDVSHTMQHWHVYQKWNGRLFEEMYAAFQNGRSTTNPVTSWYKGELWFFDNYVIPLAKKLETCGVFGVSSDEFITYATENRKEWAAKGESIVEELASKLINRNPEDVDLESSRHIRFD